MMLAIAVALFEELIFRGAIFGSLKRRLGLRTSVVVTSAIWTACHLVSGFTLVAGPYYFFVSVMLCVLAEYSSSLMPGVLFHVILDFTVGFARFDWDHILVYPGVFSFDVSHVNEWFSAWMTIGFIAISIGLRPAAQKPGTKACPALNS